MRDNLCLRCGACCAAFRVSFDRAELISAGGCVPDGLVEDETVHLVRMRGTDHTPPRCAALQGRVGIAVRCGIYAERPGPCREFAPMVAAGVLDDACVRARRKWGLKDEE